MITNDRRSVKAAGSGPFAHWLRTGRWLPEQVNDPLLEVKFNPNHDPKDDRFRFKGGGSAAARHSHKGHADSSEGQPRPVRLKDGSTVPNPNSSNRILMQPPGVSLEKNAAEGASWLGVTANMHMNDNFKPGGAMDYQRFSEATARSTGTTSILAIIIKAWSRLLPATPWTKHRWLPGQSIFLARVKNPQCILVIQEIR